MSTPIRIGVVGGGRWATMAHLPGWARDPRCRVTMLCDCDSVRAEQVARDFAIPAHVSDYHDLVSSPSVDLVDVVTDDDSHLAITSAALEAGKHVLSEKPVAHDYQETRRVAGLARDRGLVTRVGFTFRYSPAVRYARDLIAAGRIGTPYIFNGYEQNSQWLDPATPFRPPPPTQDPDELWVGSLEGYGAPIIDIAHWFVGDSLASVVGTMRNFVPSRIARGSGALTRIKVDDGDIFLGEFRGGALLSIQSSFVTVGNYPGVEARIYGSAGALIVRLVEELGICETLMGATPDQVEFRPIAIPREYYPPGGSASESWPTLCYANLVSGMLDEVLGAVTTGQADFGQAAVVQEVINAVGRSVRLRGWVDLPLAP